jgi:hypothetical protein
MAQQLEDFAKPLGLSGMLVRYFVQALAKDLPPTTRIAATPASHANHQFNRTSLNGEVFHSCKRLSVTGV